MAVRPSTEKSSRKVFPRFWREWVPPTIAPTQRISARTWRLCMFYRWWHLMAGWRGRVAYRAEGLSASQPPIAGRRSTAVVPDAETTAAERI